MTDLLTGAEPEKPAPAPAATKPAGNNTLDKLFSDLGGPAEVGRMLSISTEHAAAMKRRGSIPLEHWPALIMSQAGQDIGLTEGRLLFAHTGIVVNGGRSLVPVAPPKEEDEGAKWRWTSKDPDLLFNTQPATRVYRNGFQQIVICQESPDGDDDNTPFVFFEPPNVPKLIAALQRALKDG